MKSFIWVKKCFCLDDIISGTKQSAIFACLRFLKNFYKNFLEKVKEQENVVTQEVLAVHCTECGGA